MYHDLEDLMLTNLRRKLIMSAVARRDYAAAREAFSKMSDIGRDDRVTRYLMYKVGLHEGDDSGFGRFITSYGLETD